MSEEGPNSLETLPTFENALKLPFYEYMRYAKGIYEYRSNCQTTLVETFDKLLEWCTAMNCIKSLDSCLIPPHPEMTTNNAVSSTPFTTLPSTTLSYIQMINSVGHNGTCYDDYYCTQQYLAPYLHYMLGITCFIFCLVGILSNLLFLPAFNAISNRTGSTLYLTAMTLFDCFYMTLFTIIVVIRYIPYDYIQQLEMYARFTAYLIPHGMPTMELMELLSVWITVALLVDRFLYLKFGFHSKIMCSRKLSMKIIVVLIFFLIIYTIPKYLEYELVSYPKFKIIKVMYTSVGFSESFQNLLLHWLKVPVEMFLPYLAVAIFSILNTIKLYDLMLKRKLSEASKERKLKDQNNHLDEGRLFSNIIGDEYVKAQKFPSLATDIKIPMITNSLKCMEDKENDIVIVTLILGFSLIAIKIPKFILHALKSERYVEPDSTKFFQPATEFLDLTWVVFKPVMFITAKHFRVAVKSLFCCRDFDDEAIIQVLPVTAMDNIANDYVTKFNNSVEMKSSEDTKLLDTQVGEVGANDDVEDEVLRFKSDNDIVT